MSFLVKTALNLILKWAYSLQPEDFAKAFTFVQQAQKEFTLSTDKKKWVKEKLTEAIGSRASSKALNLLIELAVARLGK